MRILAVALLVFIVGGCRDDGSDDVFELGALPNLPAQAPATPAVDVPDSVASGDSADPVVAPVTEDPVLFADVIDHAFLPMEPGMRWVYEGDSDGAHRRDEVRVLDQTRLISGVACTVVVQEVYLDRELAEATTHYFAQDLEGNVWSFGEHSVEFGDGLAVVTEDSWEAGLGGDVPWMVLAAVPAVGDVYTGDHAGHAEQVTILAVDQTADVPAGSYEDCLSVQEEDPDDPNDVDRIIYAPGVGLASETSPTGEIRLVEFVR